MCTILAALVILLIRIPLVLNQFVCANICEMPPWYPFSDTYGQSFKFQTSTPLAVDDRNMCAAFVLVCPPRTYVSGPYYYATEPSEVHVFSSSAVTVYCGAITFVGNDAQTYFVPSMNATLGNAYRLFHSFNCLGTLNCRLLFFFSLFLDPYINMFELQGEQINYAKEVQYSRNCSPNYAFLSATTISPLLMIIRSCANAMSWSSSSNSCIAIVDNINCPPRKFFFQAFKIFL